MQNEYRRAGDPPQNDGSRHGRSLLRGEAQLAHRAIVPPPSLSPCSDCYVSGRLNNLLAYVGAVDVVLTSPDPLVSLYCLFTSSTINIIVIGPI